MTQRVITSLPADLVARIDAAAAREDRSRSSMIRKALEHEFPGYLAGHAQPNPGAPGQDLGDDPDGDIEGYDGAITPVKHEFASQGINALRCRVCGQRKAAH